MTSELSVFQVEADLRKQVRDLLEPMLEHHERGQLRLTQQMNRVEDMLARVDMLEVCVFHKTEGVTVFDKIRDQFLQVEADRQQDRMKVTHQLNSFQACIEHV